VNASAGPAFLLRNSNELELDGITSRKPLPGTPVIRLDSCLRVILRNSRAFPGTSTFLSGAPGQLRNVILEGNDLTPAQNAEEESASEFWHGREPSTEPE
jgi:hypothetical protein